MTTKKTPKTNPSWSDVKTKLADFGRAGLLGLVQGLYASSKDNKAFLHGEVLDELMDVAERLSNFPERGSYPRELISLGIKEYRQTFFKPYRVIYRVTVSQAAKSSFT
jgi:hypothetical protein